MSRHAILVGCRLAKTSLPRPNLRRSEGNLWVGGRQFRTSFAGYSSVCSSGCPQGETRDDVMQILAHRGWWTDPAEKNSEVAFRRAFAAGFGIETDVRDQNGELKISHDMPVGDDLMTLSRLLELWAEYPGAGTIALNIKADGLQAGVVAAFAAQPAPVFCFDMAVPDALGYLRQSFRPIRGTLKSSRCRHFMIRPRASGSMPFLVTGLPPMLSSSIARQARRSPWFLPSCIAVILRPLGLPGANSRVRTLQSVPIFPIGRRRFGLAARRQDEDWMLRGADD